jgi:hypothetical protein
LITVIKKDAIILIMSNVFLTVIVTHLLLVMEFVM